MKQLLDNIATSQQELITELKNAKDILRYQEDFLKKLIEILDIIEEESIPKLSQKTTDEKLKILKKYRRLIEKKSDISEVDELLDIYIGSVNQALSSNIIQLDYMIYPPLSIKIEPAWVWKFEWKNKIVEKYKQFLQLLTNSWISLNDIIVFKEKVDKKSGRRKSPYKIIYIHNWEIDKTILICDEIWQATYVYNGIIDPTYFREFKKKEKIGSSLPQMIKYSSSYTDRLSEAIFWNTVPKSKEKQVTNSVYQIKIPKETLETVWFQQLIKWRQELISMKELFEKEAGIYEEGGTWYFWDTKWMTTWPCGNSFPHLGFNRKNQIWLNTWKLSNAEHLKSVFRILWIQVATEEEEISRWWKQLTEKLELLKEEMWLIYENGIIYLFNLTGNDNWKELKGFPNGSWIKKNNIWLPWRSDVTNTEHLRKLCQILWVNIATIEQEKDRLKRELEGKEKELYEVGIILHNWVWHFNNTQVVNARTILWDYPSSRYNKKNNIWYKNGKLWKIEHFKQLFIHLGCNIATEEAERSLSLEKEKSKLQEQVECYIDRLALECNIYFENWVWYFWNAKWITTWGFLCPIFSQRFNKNYKIWDSGWHVRKIEDLKKSLELIGYQIATEEQQVHRWKKELESKINFLESIWIHFKNWKWYFCKALCCDNWSELQWFPSPDFIRKIWVWSTWGQITNITNLKIMFQRLWCQVASEEEEIEYKNTID